MRKRKEKDKRTDAFKAFEGAPEIAENEIVFDPDRDVLGKGSFGVVYKGKCRGCKVAVKVPTPDPKGFTEKQLDAFRAEVKVMAKLFHPRIALFMGAFISQHSIKIVTELLNGDLEEILLNPKKFPLSLYDRVMYAKQAAEGMAWLHGAGVVHCDYKTSNLLYDKASNSVKVCDFGLSMLVPKGNVMKESSAKGTPLYIAPEVIQGEGLDHKADVYSFGIALYEFVTRKPPFAHHSDLQEFLQAVCYDEERPELPKDPIKCPRSLRLLATSCWDADKTKRPNFEDILKKMDHIIIDAAVFDKRGRKLWKDKFISAEEGLMLEVPWPLFWARFSRRFWGKEIPIDSTVPGEDVAVKCSKAIFCKNEKVTLLHFGKTLGFFKPLEKKKVWMTDLVTICQKPWFWGSVGGGDAQSALETRGEGAYLLRFSSSGANYTLSFVADGKIWHTRILHKYQGNKYQVDGSRKEYDSLTELINAMTDSGRISKVCPGHPFANYFKSGLAGQGGYATLTAVSDSSETDDD